MAAASPPAHLRAVGRAVATVVARAPFLWPLLRAPVRRFWDRRAYEWGEREARTDPAHLAALAAALLEVPEPERALDVGTGFGDAALLIAREFPSARVRGVDISEEMIRGATKRVGLDPEGRVAFRVADASALPYDDGSFDLVALLNMPVFFAEIARVLRPGGHVVIAATFGPATPFYTPDPVLRHSFERRGLEHVGSGGAGPGTYFVARLPA
ncbi:MAG: class I SAM-dependent methyltransferase [Solirubrobacterales bacterium]